MIKEAIEKVVQGVSLTEQEMELAMREILNGQITPAQLGSLVTGLRMKGESEDEIVGAAKGMRENSLRIAYKNRGVNLDRGEINIEDETLMSTCRLGEDCTNTFNVSTAAALVIACAGLDVVKHGYRTGSNYCGSADVLEALGLNLALSGSDAQRCVHETGIAFLYDPLFHQSLVRVSGPRREIGIRSIFNLISPLINPAGCEYQVLGVYQAELTEKMARVLQRLGAKGAYVVSGESTLDEISICGPTRISHLIQDEIQTRDLFPEDFGLQRADPAEITGGNARENAKIIRDLLGGEQGAKRDLVAVNAAAAFVITGLDSTLQEGISRAKELIDSGKAREKLEGVIAFTEQCAPFVRKEF